MPIAKVKKKKTLRLKKRADLNLYGTDVENLYKIYFYTICTQDKYPQLEPSVSPMNTSMNAYNGPCDMFEIRTK